ncbi:MAG: acetyl-CoA carboxylase biotin carboxyl carrier protein [Coleofasciculaceae cyanobacterium]
MSLDFNQLRELLAAIAQTDIAELSLKSADFELMVRKGFPTTQAVDPNLVSGSTIQASGLLATPPSGVPTPNVPTPGTDLATAQAAAVPQVADQKWEEIPSPMVGTFYRSPGPDEAPYVNVGDRVNTGQVVCIIEAMKLMNEIEADVSGQVVEILVKNGEPVEYKQPLMRIKPS